MAVNRRNNLFTSTLANDDASVDQTSAVANVSEAEHVCIHFKVIGTPTGTLYFDIANGLDTDADGNPLTWEEFDNKPFAALGTQMWLDKDIPYTHVRLRWVDAGGTGTMVAVITTKGER